LLPYAFFLAVLATLGVLLGSALYEDHRFVVRERLGTELLAGLHAVLGGFAIHHAVCITHDAAVAADCNDAAARVDAAFAALDTGPARRLGLNTELAHLARHWLRVRDAGMRGASFHAGHAALGDETLELYDDLADQSNLILDPELPTYSLMELVVVHLPAVITDLGRLHLLDDADENSVNPRVIASVAAQLQEKEQHIGRDFDALAGLDVSFDRGLWQLAQETLNEIGTISRAVIAHADGGSLAEAGAAIDVLDTIERSLVVYDAVLARLDDELAARERGLTLRLTIGAVSMLVMLALTVLLYRRAASAAARLEASERRTSQVVRNMREGVAIVDAHGRILEANPSLCAMLDRSAAELQEHSLGSLLPADEALAVEQFLARTRDGHAAATDAPREVALQR
ncbi:MAG: PAS domain-containing protein, partial [Planctomycetes bacterium]|nr:PAS domain-containing protein [Planctomycetota bacterium]